MKIATLVASIAVAILVIAATAYLAISSVSVGSYTTKIQCTDAGFVVYSVTAVSGPSTSYTTTTTTTLASYNTTTTNSGKIGQITTTTVTQAQPLSGAIISISTLHSCTYIK